jgi:hypothetical protein
MKLLCLLSVILAQNYEPTFQTDPVIESTSTAAGAIASLKPISNTLGFLVKRKKIKFPSVTKRQLVKLSANIGFNESEATDELQKATVEIEKIKTLKALTETGEVPTFLTRHVTYITKEFTTLKKEINLLLGYKDPDRLPSKYLKCSQTLPGLNLVYLQALTSDLKTNVGFLQTTFTVAQLLDPANAYYENMLITLYRIRDIIDSARTIVKNYAILLDNLTAYKLRDINLWYIQMTNCVEDFLVEKYTVQECNKIKTGIECLINLKVFKSLKELNVYTPVSYHGYELAGENNEYIVKDENLHWGKLKCTENILDQSRDSLLDSDKCKFEEDKSPCLKHIESKDFAKIKKHCSFKEKFPEPVVLTDEGLLVQSKDLNLKEIDTAQQSFPIVNKEVPYLIRSDRAISVHNRETENIFEPILNQITKQIISTFLDEIQVTSLTTIQTIKNWNWEESKGDYLTITGAIMGTLLILILILVVICKKGLLRNCFKRNPTEEIEMQRRQQNYRLNRLAMKK